MLCALLLSQVDCETEDSGCKMVTSEGNAGDLTAANTDCKREATDDRTDGEVGEASETGVVLGTGMLTMFGSCSPLELEWFFRREDCFCGADECFVTRM